MKSGKRFVWMLITSAVIFAGGCTDSDASAISLIQPASAGDVLPEAETFPEGFKEETGIYVHICGEVAMPGVYAMPAGSRIVDVVNAAGGLTEEADVSLINLAREAEDGMQIAVPSFEEAADEKNQMSESGRIDINRASLEELCLLPGIGESKASDIIRYREQNGDFKRTEDIMKVAGIKEGLYEKIKEKIYVR